MRTVWLIVKLFIVAIISTIVFGTLPNIPALLNGEPATFPKFIVGIADIIIWPIVIKRHKAGKKF